MTEHILQSYANHNLLDYDGGNAEFDYLIKASEELIATITNQNIAVFALAAINPEISIENAQLHVLQKIIQDEWKLFGKQTKETNIQRTILRAVILNTLDYLIDNNDKKAAIIWLSCQHIFRYIKISNKNEEKIIHNLIQKAGKRYSALAQGDFQIVVPTFNFKLSKTSSIKLSVNKNSTKILEKLKDVTNIQTTLHRAYNSNVIVPSAANFQTWYEDFSQKLSTTLEELTTTEREAIKKYLSAVDKEFETVFQVIAKEIPKQIETSLHSLSNNNNLIWWKETLFSKSLQDSYRTMPSFVQVVTMAYDLANELNDYTPISVDYFLKETLLKVQSKEKKIILDKLQEKVLTEKNAKYLLAVLSEKELESNTSWSLLDFLNAKLYQQSNEDALTTIGIEGTTELTYAQLIVWLFHDFQALKLAQNG